MKKSFLFKGVSILGAVLLLMTSVIPGLQYAYAADYNLEIVSNAGTWNDSYENGGLKVYYENNPSEDLWNVAEDRPVNFNDKVYTAKVYLNAEGEGEYETKQFKAYWLSDQVQKITEVGTENIYYIPMFYDIPTEIFEMFCIASGGVNTTVNDLSHSSAHYIKIQSAEFAGAGVDHSWYAAVNAAGAKYPWAVISTQNFRGTIAFTYDYDNPKTVYPWGEEEIKSKSVWIASLPEEFEDNTFLIPENAANQDTGWSGTPGTSSAFDSSKFRVTLIPALTVTFVNGETTTTGEVLSGTPVIEPEKPINEGYTFLGWYLGDEVFNFDTPVTGNITLTAKWASISWSLEGYDSPHGSYTATPSEDGKTLIFTNVKLRYPGQDGTPRPADPAVWLGMKVFAPEAVTSQNVSSAKFDTYDMSQVNDGVENGKYFVYNWDGLTPDKVTAALNEGKTGYTYTHEGKWDGTDVDTLTVNIDIYNIEFTSGSTNEDAMTDFKVVNGKVTIKDGEEVKQQQSSNKSSGGGGGGSSKTTKADDTKATTGDTVKVDDTNVENNNEENVNEENKDEEKAPMTDAQAVEKFGQEQIDAYKWALGNGITTMKTVEAARLDESLTRAELAKMMVVYIQKVLEKDPIVTGDVTYPDVDESLGDLYGYIKLAYQYQIMGINADGTPIEFFNPYGIVTRGEYATVFSRVLFGDKFNKDGEDFYSKHLEALKAAGILTNTIPTIHEMRGWVMLMMYRSSQNTEAIEKVANTTEATEEESSDETANEEKVSKENENTEESTANNNEEVATENAEETTEAEATEVATGDVAEAPAAEASTGDVATN